MAALTVVVPGGQLAHLDEPNQAALQQWLGILGAAENSLVKEGGETVALFQQFRVGMEERFAALFREKQLLREQLEQQQGRQREMEVLHQAEIAALKKQVATSDEAAKTAKNEMKAAAAKAEERIAATIAAQAQAVNVAIQAGNARVEAARLAEREGYCQAYAKAYSAAVNAQHEEALTKARAEWEAETARGDAEWEALFAQRDAEWEAAVGDIYSQTVAETRKEYTTKYKLIPKRR